MKPKLSKLQKMIDRTVKAGNVYHKAQAELNEFCSSEYGNEPGDIDADQIIDSVFGGCGMASGMRAEDFDRIMRNDN